MKGLGTKLVSYLWTTQNSSEGRKKNKKEENVVKFEDFQSLANAFYRSLGTRPYDIFESSHDKLLRSYLLFYGGIINVKVLMILQIIQAINAINKAESINEILEPIILTSFMFVSTVKLLVLIQRRPLVNDLMQRLNTIFPTSAESQQKFETKNYLKLVQRTTFIISLIYCIIFVFYIFYGVGLYLIHDCWLQDTKVGLALPLPTYIPWNWKGHWSYYLVFIWHLLGGHTAVSGQIAADLFLYSAATHLIMQYDFVARAIENYEIKATTNGVKSDKGKKQDLKFIHEIIAYHNNILDLSSILNKVFGLSLLLNFACTCGTICLCAFFATIDIGIEIRLKFGLSLWDMMVQNYFVTYYGQLLIDASTNIADAAYRQNWPFADKDYQKMLVLIIQRAQKTAFLTATHLVAIKQGTFSAIVQVTYEVLCVLQNMYANKNP